MTGTDNPSVSWSVEPAGVGSIDAAGQYTAPLATPSPDTVSIVASSAADPSATGTAAATLATAFPSASRPLTGSTQLTGGVFPHSIATSGSRVYAVWSTAASTSPSLMVARSDDAGATWKPAVAAMHVTLAGGDSEPFDCMSIAIDAGSPDVLYVYGRVPHENDVGDAKAGSGGVTSLLAVSTDGGATFSATVMQVGGTAGGPHNGWDSVGVCGDVASPAPNTVVVESPGGYSGDGNPDIAVWADAARGAGFAQGVALDNDYLADGYTDALDNLQGNHDIDVAQNGGTDDAGGMTESPRLFTDGQGRLCTTYYGTTFPSNHSQAHTYVQCSDATAKQFTAPTVVDPAQPLDAAISSPVGAFGPSHTAALLWTTGLTDKGLLVATSTDGAATFGAPVRIPTYVLPGGQGQAGAKNPNVAYDASGILWIAYRAYDGGSFERIIVDKSCDNGKTWSGAVLVNGPESAVTNLFFPTLVMTPGDAPQVAATTTDHRVLFGLAP